MADRRPIAPVVAVLAALLTVGLTAELTGCSVGSTSNPLGGHTFVSTSVSGHDLVPGTRITLTFGASQIGADAGCNHMGGGYSLDGDTLRIGTLSMTEMACEPATKMDQDQWVAEVLGSDPTFTLTGSTLTLTSGVTRIVLSEQIAVDQPLEGPTWVLTTILGGSGPDATAQDATLATDPATVSIDHGRISLSAGVNVGSGPVTVSGNTITFGSLMVTLRPVRDDRRGHIEAAVLGVLTGTVTYTIDGDTLTLTTEDGMRGLVYRAVTTSTQAQ